MTPEEEGSILAYAEKYSQGIENVRAKHWLLTALTAYVHHEQYGSKNEVRKVLREKFFTEPLQSD